MAAMAQVTVVAALAVPKMWARQVSKSMITMWTPSRPPSSPHGKACAHAWRAVVLRSLPIGSMPSKSAAHPYHHVFAQV